MTVEDIARTCHEVNRAYCESLNDDSQKPWKEAPDWQRNSAISGVLFHLQNPDAGPSGSHTNWCREKEQAGWKFGPIKSEHRKEHPCMVPYEQLPDYQRTKDALFVAVVHSMKHLLPQPLTTLERAIR